MNEIFILMLVGFDDVSCPALVTDDFEKIEDWVKEWTHSKHLQWETNDEYRYDILDPVKTLTGKSFTVNNKLVKTVQVWSKKPNNMNVSNYI